MKAPAPGDRSMAHDWARLFGRHSCLGPGVQSLPRELPSSLADIYRYSNGILFGTGKVGGDNFRHYDRGYAYRLVPFEKLRSVYEDGYCARTSPIAELVRNWLVVVEVGDGDCVAINLNHSGFGEIIDVFHETAGEVGCHGVVADTLTDWIERSVASHRAWWLDAGTRPSKAY